MSLARRNLGWWAEPVGSTRLRTGFALAVALLALVVLALVAALLLDAALQELRASRGDVALVRAEAASESALADLISAPVDSAVSRLPRGAARESVRVTAGDTVRLTVQSLGGGLVRAVLAARARAAGARADVTTLALLRMQPDSGPPPALLRYRRLPGWWWAHIP
jgi:hypothetical protein